MLRAVVLPLLLAAQPAVQDAAPGVLDDRVHVDPVVSAFVDELRVRAELTATGESIFVAVLPPDTSSAPVLAMQLGERVRIEGTYVVLAGDDLGAASNVLERGTAGELAAAARAAVAPGDPTAVLVDVLRRIDRAAALSGRSTDRGGQPGFPWVLLVLPLGFLWLVLARAGGAGAAGAAVDDRRRLAAEAARLAAEVRALGPPARGRPSAAHDLAAAARRSKVAEAALGEDDADVARVARVLEETRWALARASARIDGRPPPRPPEVLRRPGPTGEPAVTLDGRGEPVYAGGAGRFADGAWFDGRDRSGGLLLGDVVGDYGAR